MRARPAPGRRGRLVCFAAVGGVNTLTFSACYLPLHRLLPYFAAYTAAFAVSMVGAFFLHTYVTYRTRPTWTKFLLFPLTQVTNYGVQSAGLVALVGWCGLDTALAPPVAALCAVPFSYLLSRRILRPSHRPSPARSGPARHAPERPGPARPGPAAQAGPPSARSGPAA
ncbi:GtrA family protein [Streptomyces angustmyceticus]|uniref:GtrA family protein n=1 Tax=Streptomyces angustmyceticus TaxID=285578 RepID=UPI0038213EC3